MDIRGSASSRARSLLGRYPGVLVVPVAWIWILADPVGRLAYGISIALLAVAVVLETARVRAPHARWAVVPVPSLVFLAAVGCLRQAGGGLASGVGILALVPIFQVALSRRRRSELWVLLAAEAALYLVPIVVVGGAAYPHTQYRAGILTVAVSSIVGLATQGLVGRVRREASDARESRNMLAQVNALVHELFDAGDVRAALSAGSVRIAGATIAILLEPDPLGEVLRATASVGLPGSSLEVPLRVDNPIGGAFLSGVPRLVEEIDERQLAAPAVWRAIGRPETILYLPLVRDGVSIAVLAVAWVSHGAVVEARVSAVELLAHQAALVLDRSDRVLRLTDMAETDPLTGLPNRRAWDLRVAAALREGRGIAVALFDVDHFKRYNDTHGHPAGDRLLRELCAAWREMLRGEDVLARLGGEEFGLLLLDCEPRAAAEVTERLRAARVGQATCSAGLAVRRAGEPFEAVVARADAALYEAKSAGRDIARVAG